MSRVVLMCGPAGSGKSTVARRLEAEGLTRLSIDHEARRRGITTMPLAPEVRRAIELELQTRLLDLVARGTDVVLDFSFWSRESRTRYRRLLAGVGVVPETMYLATPREVALARVAARVGEGEDFTLPVELAAAYYDHFEPPTDDEGPLVVVDVAADSGGRG